MYLGPPAWLSLVTDKLVGANVEQAGFLLYLAERRRLMAFCHLTLEAQISPWISTVPLTCA